MINFLKIGNKEKGFTLVELLVAMSLFIVLIGIATGGFVRALRTQRATVELMSVNDNAVSAIEQMAREIRTAGSFVKVSEEELQFINANGLTVSYRLNNEAIEYYNPLKGTYKITADNVKIVGLNFILLDDPAFPPRITISLSAGGTNSYIKDVIMHIQTTISSRAI